MSIIRWYRPSAAPPDSTAPGVVTNVPGNPGNQFRVVGSSQWVHVPGVKWQLQKLYDNSLWRIEFTTDMISDPSSSGKGVFSVAVMIDGQTYIGFALPAPPGQDITFGFSLGGMPWSAGTHTVELLVAASPGEIGTFLLSSAAAWYIYEEEAPAMSQPVRVS